MAESDLTRRQRRFVEEYLVDLNATRAATRAGYSAHTARSQGERLLTHVDVAPAIQAAIMARSLRTQVTQDRVVTELARVGFSRMDAFATWGATGVTLLSSASLEEDAARCVAEVSQSVTKDGGAIRFKLHDKVTALTQLGRHLGMFVDRQEHAGPGGGPMTFSLVIGDPEHNARRKQESDE